MKKIIISLLILMLITAALPVNTAQNPGTSFFDDSIKTVGEDIYRYYSYENMTNLLYQLQENNSHTMSVTSIGKTYEGRNVWLVKISDNVTQEEDEPGVLLMGAHHGNEKASYEVLIYFIRHMVENYSKENTDNDEDGQINEDPIDGFDNDEDGQINEDPIDGFDNDEDGLMDEDPSEDRVREAINNTQIYLIPMVNPDGVEANTRKNCAPNRGAFGFRKEITSYGVDINRNYGYKWYSWFIRPWRYHYMSQLRDEHVTYRGEKPFCENETKAIKNFVEFHKINISLSYHGYASYIFYPWFYSNRLTRDENQFFKVARNILQINKYKYISNLWVLGLLFEFRGVAGTSEDWLYGSQGVLAFCVELSEPKSPDDVLRTCKTHVGVNLYICEKAKTVNTNQKIWLTANKK